MSKIDIELEDILGLPAPLENKELTFAPEAKRSPDETILADFDQVRANLDVLSKKGLEVFERMAELATETEDVKAIEALGGLLEKIAKVNLSLLDAHEKKRKIVAGDNVKDAPKENATTSNTYIDNRQVIMGTTEEILSKMDKNGNTD